MSDIVYDALCCRQCGEPLALTTATRLYLGAVTITQRVTMVCRRCGSGNQWHPGEFEKTFDKPPHMPRMKSAARTTVLLPHEP